MRRADIVRELDAYIETIMQPLSAQDMESGWDANHQQKAITIMNEIREALRQHKPLPKWSIVRTMDSWGVDGGLFDRACAIAHRLHDIED